MNQQQAQRERTQLRRGVTLVETVLALLILGGAFVAVLNTVGSSRAAYFTAGERALGTVLAEDLMAEVLSRGYIEEGFTLLGIDGTEALGPGRSQFDDVDDYNGWASTPPVDVDGNAIAGAEAYTRAVAVKWVEPLAPETTRGSDGGVKRVVVTVTRGGKVIAELTGYATDAWPAAGEGY